MGQTRRLGACVASAVALATAILHGAENLTFHRNLENLADPALAIASNSHTENGFYYSFYSGLVEAESVASGLEAIIWDTRTEHPDVINSFQRFNVYQEAALALTYRALRSCGLAFVSAWTFFHYSMLAHNSLGQAALSLLSWEISGNPGAGILCFLLSFLNRTEISRFSRDAPGNLREFWGCPLLWMQVLFLWQVITGGDRSTRLRRFLWRGFTTATFLFLVSWQFGPFLLLLQATSLYFVCLVCGYRNIRAVFASVLNGYIAAMVAAIAVHFGSLYLLTSPFLAQLVALKVSTSLRSLCTKSGGRGAGRVASPVKRCVFWVGRRLLDVLEGLVALAAFACVLKVMAPFATEDTHIYEIACTKAAVINGWLPRTWQLPKSRLPRCTEPTFNARLYTISGVFNELELESLQTYRETTASPAAAVTCGLVLLRCILSLLLPSRSLAKGDSSNGGEEPAAERAEGDEQAEARAKGEEAPAPSREAADSREGHARGTAEHEDAARPEERDEAAQLFFVVQFLLFFLLGALMNRLRAVFGPPMMVLAASVFGPRLLPWWRRRSWWLALLLVLHTGYTVLVAQMLPCATPDDGLCSVMEDKDSYIGGLVDLAEWANLHLPPDLPLLASIALSGTLRPFLGNPMVIHPQFESENMRKRAQLGYEMHHCGSEASFAQAMETLDAEVVIFEYRLCSFAPISIHRSKTCVAGKHEPEDQLCLKLHASTGRFKLLFMNGDYVVFKLQKGATSSNLSPAMVRKALGEEETWAEYIQACDFTQGKRCAASLAENVVRWRNGLGQHEVAEVLQALLLKRFPDDGFAAYYIGRHVEIDLGDARRAGEYYAMAAERLPDNPVVLKEYLMWLELEAEDAAKVKELIERGRGRGRPLLELAGPSVSELLCEAAASARELGQAEFSKRLWAKSLRLAPLSRCVKRNWPLMHPGSTFEESHSKWDLVWHLFRAGAPRHIGFYHGTSVRHVEVRPYALSPAQRR